MRIAAAHRIIVALFAPLCAHPALANTAATVNVPQLPSTTPQMPLSAPHSAAPAPLPLLAPALAPMLAPMPAPSITIGRAVDLVGVPLRMAQPKVLSGADKTPSLRGLGMGALGPFAMPSGMPVAARALTSGFGLRRHPILGGLRSHAGLDLAAPMGTPVVATSAGVVSADGWYGGYGLLVAVDHGGGVQTRYGHMSRLAVAAGQRVRKGEVIGYVGSTGRSTGPHLHYEMRIGGQAVNPLSTLGRR